MGQLESHADFQQINQISPILRSICLDGITLQSEEEISLKTRAVVYNIGGYASRRSPPAKHF